MASSVEELLDMLFELIDGAKSFPLSSDKCLLDREKALDFLDEIRAQFPVELGEAKKLLNTKNDYIAAAKRDGENIRRQAEEQAHRMVEESEILVQAKNRANEIIRQAEDRSRELRRVAIEYCEDAMKRTEDAVADAYDEVKNSHIKFRSLASAAFNAPSEGNAPRSVPYDAAQEKN